MSSSAGQRKLTNMFELLAEDDDADISDVEEGNDSPSAPNNCQLEQSAPNPEHDVTTLDPDSWRAHSTHLHSRAVASTDWRTDAQTSQDQRGYNFTPGPKTRNGVLWSTIHRGSIVKMRDVRRYWANDKKAGNDGVVLGPDGELWMDKPRFFLVTDRYSTQAQTRAIYTNGGQGLKTKSIALKRQSMCFRPRDVVECAPWTNEAHPNDALNIKWIHRWHALSPLSSITVTQVITKDIDEEYELIGEVEEESMDRMEALENSLKQEPRR